MRIVVFGLTISSSWGNGHATLWRGLVRALSRLGCSVVFFEHDTPYYAANRDACGIAGCELALYSQWSDIAGRAGRELAAADAAIVSSYCPDAVAATELLSAQHRLLRVFYDLDTPVTLARIASGEPVEYLGETGLSCFDLTLSFTGGGALSALSQMLGARRVAPLYGHVDPDVYRKATAVRRYRADLSYLGTYAEDRQRRLSALLVSTATCRPDLRFVIGGAQYPAEFPWQPNIHFVRHLPPVEHPSFFSSSRLTLNITRAAMVAMGWCPSGRLFEAAACGTPVISDLWEGLSDFYTAGSEIILARSTADVLATLQMDDAQLARIGRAARDRTLAEHTSMHRARELLGLLESARSARDQHREVENA